MVRVSILDAIRKSKDERCRYREYSTHGRGDGQNDRDCKKRNEERAFVIAHFTDTAYTRPCPLKRPVPKRD
jgi:hypothetical protein